MKDSQPTPALGVILAGGRRFRFNPDLSYQLNKFRSSADDSCEEVIVLG
jgi:hypothetical protein